MISVNFLNGFYIKFYIKLFFRGRSSSVIIMEDVPKELFKSVNLLCAMIATFENESLPFSCETIFVLVFIFFFLFRILNYNELPSDSLFHSVRGVRIRSYSGPYFPAFGLNTERYGVRMREITD